MEEFLKQLGIDGKLNKSSKNVYVLDIDNSDEYGKIYSKLDKSDLVTEVDDSSQITYDTASIQFESDEFMITLLADFENDTYKMTIKEI
jgi:hypothetical protein